MYKDQYPPLEPDCYYHIYNRGINGENLFIEQKNYLYFKTLLKNHVLSTVDILAYSLLKNHFHLCVQIKKEQFSKSSTAVSKNFSNLFNTYTKAINKNYKRTGSLFETPFKRKKISSDIYISQVIYYIHANAQKHGLVDDFRKYPHSSFQDFLNDDNTLINIAEVIQWFGSKEHFTKYHELYREEMMLRSIFD